MQCPKIKAISNQDAELWDGPDTATKRWQTRCLDASASQRCCVSAVFPLCFQLCFQLRSLRHTVLRQVGGHPPAPWMRPPAGSVAPPSVSGLPPPRPGVRHSLVRISWNRDHPRAAEKSRHKSVPCGIPSSLPPYQARSVTE